MTTHVDKVVPYDVLVASIDEWPCGIVIAGPNGTESADGRIIYANRAFEEMSGYSADEVVERPRSILDGPATDRNEITRLSAPDRQHAQRPPARVKQYRKNGSSFAVDLTSFPLSTGHWVYVYREVAQDEFVKQEAMHLLDALAAAIQAAPGEEEALTSIIQLLCRVSGWRLGEAWMTQRDGEVMRAGPAWHACDNPPYVFLESSRAKKIHAGEGLIGRVWATREPEWIDDVSAVPPERFIRKDAAEDAGFGAALAVPVLSGDDVYGVLAFFLDRAHDRDEVMCRVLADAVLPLGLLLENKRVQRQLIASARQKAALATLAKIILDESSIDAVCDAAARLAAKALSVDRAAVIEIADDGALIAKSGCGLAVGVLGRVDLTRRGNLLDGPHVFTRADPQSPLCAIGDDGLCAAMLTAPVEMNATEGVLAVFDPDPARFGKSEERFLQSLASVLSKRG